MRADYLEWNEMKHLVNTLNDELIELSSKDNFKIKSSTGRMALLIHFGSLTALRISDILSLTWDDLRASSQIRNNLTLKERKTGKTRRISLHEDIRHHLQWHYELTSPSGFIFQNRCGEAITPRFANYELKRLQDKYKLGIGNFSTHSFRKTWSRHIWEASGRNPGTLEMLSIALNHSSISNTRIYLGITQEEISDLYLNV